MKIKWVKYFVVLILILTTKTAFASREPIIYQSEINYPPYKFESNGYFTGFDIDISNMIFNNENSVLKISVDSWEKVYERLKKGEIDTCGMLVVNEDRKKDILYSKPLFKTYTAAYTRKSFQKVNLDNINNFVVGVGKNQYSERLVKHELGIEKYRTYITIDDALYALKNGEIDVLFENQEVVNYLIVEKGLKGEIIHQLSNLYPQNVAYGFSKSRADLVEYTNNKIDEIRKSGIFEEVNEKYFFRKSDFYREHRRNNIILAASAGLLALLLVFISLRIYIKKLSKRLYNEKELTDDIIDNTTIVIIAVDKNKNIFKCNKNIEKFGLSINQIINKKYNTLRNINKSYSFIVRMFDKAMKLDLINNEEVQVEKQDGKSFVYSFRTSVIYDSDGKPDLFLLAGIDTTESKEYEYKLQQSYNELEATYEELVATEEELKEQYDELAIGQEKLRFSEERFRLATEAANDIIWEENPSIQTAYYSDRWYEILGYPKNEEDTSNQMWEKLVHPDDNAKVETAMNNHFDGNAPFYKCEYRLKAESGEYKWFLSKGKALKNSDGDIIRFIGSSTDITEIKNYQLKLQKLAYRDALTGLPNKASFKEDFERAISGDNTAALLYIDMDNFKYINDTMGHSNGDKVLQRTGKEIANLIGEHGIVYRLGGDEFSVISCGIRNRQEVERIADSILEGFKRPFSIQGAFINISLSIGISIYPWDSKLDEDLIVYSDIAMYKSKELGKGKYTFYNESMREAIERRIMIEKHLREAIDNNELYLHYQPQFDIKTGKIDGFEALLRWNSPDLGFVPPLSFIKIAEESQLIIPIGEWILKTACLFLKSLQEKGYNDYRISVNISIVQLIQENFVDRVLEILKDVGIPEKFLELEITESILMESFERLNHKLEILRSKGIRIALDDFGTGYSSLSYLRKLKVNTLKIDKAFINDILINDESKALTTTIIDIGHKVNLEVIAEGVEDKKQLEFLTSNRCDKIQGFLFSKPVSEQEILNMLGNEKKN